MLSGTFVSEVTEKKSIEIPSEIVNRLNLSAGDKVEVLIKRIRTKRFDIKISKNPLLKLFEITESR